MPVKPVKVLSVVGARPNFMKVGPLHRAFEQVSGIDSIIVHTGQHYDERMSEVFFEQLELPEPDIYLGVGSGSHAAQTARIMMSFEGAVMENNPDLVLVVGDVNSTVACSLVAAKCHIPIAHVEAGLRSGDRSMPEEINRVVTDSLSTYLFVTEQSGLDNLKKEGVADEKIFFVGNVMIDSLVQFREKAGKKRIMDELAVKGKGYVLMTMHRPSNVDALDQLILVVETVEQVSERIPVVLPLHPRTRNRLESYGLLERLRSIPSVKTTQPLGYLEFLNLMDNSVAIITDSGGVQEESTYLQIPCLTVRDNTERPVTVTMGTNELHELAPDKIVERVESILCGDYNKGVIPPLWDGSAAVRVARILEQELVSPVR